MMLKHEMQVNL